VRQARVTGTKDTGQRTKARWFAALWIGLAVVVWLGMFDVLISRGVKEYLYRAADHDLGRGPAVTMPEIMGQTIHDAVIDCSLWAVLIGGAGLWTVYGLAPAGTKDKR
jgi:hypothetical protein